MKKTKTKRKLLHTIVLSPYVVTLRKHPVRSIVVGLAVILLAVIFTDRILVTMQANDDKAHFETAESEINLMLNQIVEAVGEPDDKITDRYCAYDFPGVIFAGDGLKCSVGKTFFYSGDQTKSQSIIDAIKRTNSKILVVDQNISHGYENSTRIQVDESRLKRESDCSLVILNLTGNPDSKYDFYFDSVKLSGLKEKTGVLLDMRCSSSSSREFYPVDNTRST